MSNYQDRWSRYHHKLVTESNPVPSGNGWVYTAYAQKLGLPVNPQALEECFKACLIKLGDRYEIIRSPGYSGSPISRDEILGLSALGLLKERHLTGWDFPPYPLPRFNPIKLAKQIWQLRPTLERNEELPFDPRRPIEYRYKIVWKHRNYFWQNNLDQLYRFAFSVPLTDRAFVAEHSHIKLGLISRLFYKAIAAADKALPKKPNGISWLKYGKGLEEMKAEFPADHPISKD